MERHSTSWRDLAFDIRLHLIGPAGECCGGILLIDRSVAPDQTVAQCDDPPCKTRDVRLVRYHQNGQAAAIEALQEVDHLEARPAVEVAGRFVGQQDPRLRHKCPRDGDSLLVLDDGRIPHLNDRPAELTAASKVDGSIRAMTCPRRTVLLKSAVTWSTMPETWLPTITVCSGWMDPWAITRCETSPYSTVSTCSGGNPRPPAARCETPYHTARTRIGMMRRNNLPGFINKRPEGARYMTNQLRTRRYDNDDCMAVPKGRRSPQQIPPKQFPEGGDR